MNTFEITLNGQRTHIIVKADTFGYSCNWITFYDKSVASDVQIVAIFAASNVMCVIRKDCNNE